jgi:hypothetical protein
MYATIRPLEGVGTVPVMLGNWFNCKEVDEFADAIVADLVKRFPPSGVDAPAKKAAERLKKTHDVIFGRVDRFARSRPLNLYKKAHLGNRVKWALKEAGYPDDFVDTLTYELVTVVTLVSGKGNKVAT